MRVLADRRFLTLACALIIGSPAAVTVAGDYRLDSTNQVKHHHVNNYPVYFDLTGDWKTQAEAAQEAWNTRLNTVDVTKTSTHSAAEIHLQKATGSDNGVRAAWTSGYHSTHTDVTFNSYYNFTFDEKRGRSCQAIGGILGLDTPGPDRDDCMEDPQTYGNPQDKSVQLVDDFYGPNMEVGGSVVDASPQLLTGSDYTLEVEASGHAMARIDAYLDGSSTPFATSSTTSACAEKCSRTLSMSITDPSTQIGMGNHTITVVAKNEFGVAGGTGSNSRSTSTIPVSVVTDPVFVQTGTDELTVEFDPGETASVGIGSNEDDEYDIFAQSASLEVVNGNFVQKERNPDGSVSTTIIDDVADIEAQRDSEYPSEDTGVELDDYDYSGATLSQRPIQFLFRCNNAGPIVPAVGNGYMYSYHSVVCYGPASRTVAGVRYHGCIERKRNIGPFNDWPDEVCKDSYRSQAAARTLYYRSMKHNCDHDDYRTSNKISLVRPGLKDGGAMYKSHTRYCA